MAPCATTHLRLNLIGMCGFSTEHTKRKTSGGMRNLRLNRFHWYEPSSKRPSCCSMRHQVLSCQAPSCWTRELRGSAYASGAMRPRRRCTSRRLRTSPKRRWQASARARALRQLPVQSWQAVRVSSFWCARRLRTARTTCAKTWGGNICQVKVRKQLCVDCCSPDL